jgi:DNA-binding IclR family transcriptional regulator
MRGADPPVSEAHAVTALATAGSLTQGELVTRLHLTKGTVSRIVRILGERGRVERRRQQKLAAMLAAVPLHERQRVVDALAMLAKAAGATP